MLTQQTAGKGAAGTNLSAGGISFYFVENAYKQISNNQNLLHFHAPRKQQQHYSSPNQSSSAARPPIRCLLLSNTALKDSCSARNLSLNTLCFFHPSILWDDDDDDDRFSSSDKGFDFCLSVKCKPFLRKTRSLIDMKLARIQEIVRKLTKLYPSPGPITKENMFAVFAAAIEKPDLPTCSDNASCYKNETEHFFEYVKI